MIVETFAVGLLHCNCTILGDESSLEAVVVDPGADIPRIMAAVTRHALTVKQILVTHAHIDHIAGAQALQQLTGAPIFFNQADLMLVAIMAEQAAWIGIPTPEVNPPDADLSHGLPIHVGSIHGTIIHTPGHTEGSVCLHLPAESLLLAGDTLFAGSVGRTDLPGGDSRTLLRSIHDRLMVLPEATRVIPGHGPSTTIGAERDQNPWLNQRLI